MAIFKLNKNDFTLSELASHRFASEGYHKVSPQELIASFPSLILSIPELEVSETEKLLVTRELSTSRGAIDVLIITRNLDIVLIETKLFRNPESHRTVVAQTIDYIRALSEIDMDYLKNNFKNSAYTEPDDVDDLFEDDFFVSALDKNLRTGNFKVVIVGDRIHPNVLNMVESIQSAPHLAFTMYLAEIQPYELGEDNLLIYPKIVSNTNEVERSVIKLEIDYKHQTHTIESSIPQKERKGSRPIITEEQFLKSLSVPEFAEVFREFWQKWKTIGGDIRFGVLGFSAGIRVSGTRIPLQSVIYNEYLYLITPKVIENHDIDETIYESYKNELKESFPRGYDLLIGNKAMVVYKEITKEELERIFNATIHMAKLLLKENED